MEAFLIRDNPNHDLKETFVAYNRYLNLMIRSISTVRAVHPLLKFSIEINSTLSFIDDASISVNNCRVNTNAFILIARVNEMVSNSP